MRRIERMVSNFQNVYIFHGQGGSPEGTALVLEGLLYQRFPKVKFIRPLLRHQDEGVTARDSFRAAAKKIKLLQKDSLIIGISMGGLVASVLQEKFPDLNLSVFAISSPTKTSTLAINTLVPDKRVALYSHLDKKVGEYTIKWPLLTNLAFDVSWMQSHNTDDQKYSVTSVIAAFMSGQDVSAAVENVFNTSLDTLPILGSWATDPVK
jgi:pimeloyl-ACP methyl ester carboxylesterase